eukprot:gene23350-30260_t
MVEIWREVTDYEIYEVSNLGRIRNSKTGKMLTGTISLEALEFVDNPGGKDFVDHKNNDRLDNRVENLRWATRQENSANRKLNINNTSGIKGSFNTKEDAKQARINKARQMFGEFINDCEM